MRFRYILMVLIAVILTGCISQEAYNNTEQITYYVSSINGDDNNTGFDEEEPIASISKVNSLKLNPGDKVLFECDSIFRGHLIPQSGEEFNAVIYDSYGEGEQPVIVGSVSIFDDVVLEKLQDDIYGIYAEYDVGNIIINDGEIFGSKKFKIEDLINPLDYFYDTKQRVLYIYLDEELKNIVNDEDSE